MPGILRVPIGMKPQSGLMRVLARYQPYLDFYECQQAKSHSLVLGKFQ